MRFHKPIRHRCQPVRAGVAVVELAVCLPVLMLIVIATVESSAMIFLQQSLSIAAYEGARISLTPGAGEDEVTQQCNLILDDRNVQLATVSTTPADLSDVSPGEWIAVETGAPFGENSLVGGWLFANKNLSARVEMMKER